MMFSFFWVDPKGRVRYQSIVREMWWNLWLAIQTVDFSVRTKDNLLQKLLQGQKCTSKLSMWVLLQPTINTMVWHRTDCPQDIITNRRPVMNEDNWKRCRRAVFPMKVAQWWMKPKCPDFNCKCTWIITSSSADLPLGA